jgi:hypothetical protein
MAADARGTSIETRPKRPLLRMRAVWFAYACPVAVLPSAACAAARRAIGTR